MVVPVLLLYTLLQVQLERRRPHRRRVARRRAVPRRRHQRHHHLGQGALGFEIHRGANNTFGANYSLWRYF